MIPECLARTAEVNAALTQAEDLLDSLLSMPAELRLETEISFMEGQIEDLKHQLSVLDEETEKIYQHLREWDHRAYLCTVLHFKTGLKWDEVAEYVGGKTEAVKMTVYRALDSLFKGGMIS